MLMDGIDASTAAYEVGYESVSQFTREYSRVFGQPQCGISRRFETSTSSVPMWPDADHTAIPRNWGNDETRSRDLLRVQCAFLSIRMVAGCREIIER